MTARLFIVWLATGMCLLLSASSSFAVSLGATKAEVIEELGRPTSAAARGDREILSYPKGVRLVLIEGRVDSATGIVLSGEVGGISKSPAAPSATPAPTTNPAKKAPKEDSDDEETDSGAARDGSPAEHVTHDPTMQGSKSLTGPNFDPESFAEHSPASSKARPLLEVAALLVFHFVVTLIALKLAFKFWTMDSLLPGLFAIASIDLALHVVLELIGPLTSGLSTLPAVENSIPGVVMIFTIRHFCFNKNIADAVQTASVVKTAVLLLKMFGAVAMLNAAFR